MRIIEAPPLAGRLTESATADSLVEHWMQEHGPSVLRLAYAFLLDRHQAEDVYQDVFVKAHQHAHRLQDPGKTRAWLLQTTANRCRDLRRSWWWRRVLATRPAPAEEAGALDQIADQDRLSDPAAALTDSARKAAVARAVWELPEGYREAIALYYFEGMTAPEVARMLGIREGTVHSRLHRGRELLRTKLENWGVEP